MQVSHYNSLYTKYIIYSVPQACTFSPSSEGKLVQPVIDSLPHQIIVIKARLKHCCHITSLQLSQG